MVIYITLSLQKLQNETKDVTRIQICHLVNETNVSVNEPNNNNNLQRYQIEEENSLLEAKLNKLEIERIRKESLLLRQRLRNKYLLLKQENNQVRNKYMLFKKENE
ncbi:5316_t:CDS:2 [Gigaspora margarita]|uniref:5316_t:CDS:1 n=1 Tax=Gigaspora margarita TaxID=4874 RepID=A0ABM8W3K2_GIGMA|nr:5316_t:CDS:2 [Gigaspora margarita]